MGAIREHDFSARRVRALAAPIIVLLAALAFAAPSNTNAAHQDDADTLERMARENFGALSAAERTLVRSAPNRRIAWAGSNDNPDDPLNDPANADKWAPDRCIRAEVLAWLVSEAKAAPYIHPSGAGIAAARIIGQVDLSYREIRRPLTLIRCALPDGIDFSHASLHGIDLRAGTSGPITGDMSQVTGDVSIRFGRYGPLSLYRASISGDLDCTGSSVTGEEAISAVDATIGGDALFHQGFTTNGTVDFRLAKLGHSLSFSQARFTGTGRNGLDAERASMDGAFYWTAIEHTPGTTLDLEQARATALWDDRQSWPAAGNLIINGLRYDSFGGDSPADSASRLQWLALQPRGYHPQPFVQLAEVLRREGRIGGSTDVLIAQRVAQRRFGALRWPERAWNAMLEVTIGYGYRPLRALWWIAGFVLLGAALFGWGYRARVITPCESGAYEVFARTGAAPRHYPGFNALVYSLENFVPVVDLHQGNYWRPNPFHQHQRLETADGGGSEVSRRRILASMLRYYLWIHIMAGWILTPLLFAGLSGLIRVE